jgi:hypothetical protein
MIKKCPKSNAQNGKHDETTVIHLHLQNALVPIGISIHMRKLSFSRLQSSSLNQNKCPDLLKFCILLSSRLPKEQKLQLMPKIELLLYYSERTKHS